MPRFVNVEDGHWVDLGDLPDDERALHLRRIEDSKAVAQRRAERQQQAAVAEEARRTIEGGLAAGEAAAEAFLSKTRRSYDLEGLRPPTSSPEPQPDSPPLSPSEQVLRSVGY